MTPVITPLGAFSSTTNTTSYNFTLGSSPQDDSLVIVSVANSRGSGLNPEMPTVIVSGVSAVIAEVAGADVEYGEYHGTVSGQSYGHYIFVASGNFTGTTLSLTFANSHSGAAISAYQIIGLDLSGPSLTDVLLEYDEGPSDSRSLAAASVSSSYLTTMTANEDIWFASVAINNTTMVSWLTSNSIAASSIQSADYATPTHTLSTAFYIGNPTSIAASWGVDYQQVLFVLGLDALPGPTGGGPLIFLPGQVRRNGLVRSISL